MQHMMTRWIETADARAACEAEMARQMLAGPAASEPNKSLFAALRLPMLLEPMNRCFGLRAPSTGR